MFRRKKALPKKLSAYESLDQMDVDYIKKYALENGIEERLLIKFLQKYYCECIYTKMDTLHKFRFGDLLTIYKHEKTNVFMKICDHFGFYKRLTRFRAEPFYQTKWNRKASKWLYPKGRTYTNEEFWALREQYAKELEDLDSIGQQQTPLQNPSNISTLKP